MPKIRKIPLNSQKSPGSGHPYTLINDLHKKLEEIQCPICMEHPHNPVLVLCSSYEKGCRPYMCDTGSTMSNCYSQFQNSSTSSSCPLCRGEIKGYENVSNREWIYMNSKPRTCWQKDCNFSGTYMELTEHVTKDHTEVDQMELYRIGPVRVEEDYNEVINASLFNNSNQSQTCHGPTSPRSDPLIMIHYSEHLIENTRCELWVYSYVSSIEGESDDVVMSLANQRVYYHMIKHRGIDEASSDQNGDFNPTISSV